MDKRNNPEGMDNIITLNIKAEESPAKTAEDSPLWRGYNDPPLQVACASLQGTPCDVEGNKGQILAAMEKARKAKADLLVLPRLCLVGATCGNMLLDRWLMDKAWQALEEIARASGELLVFVGLPVLLEGIPREVCAFVHKGVIQYLAPYMYPVPPLERVIPYGYQDYRGIQVSYFANISLNGWVVTLHEAGKETVMPLFDDKRLMVFPQAAPYVAGGAGDAALEAQSVSLQEEAFVAIARPGPVESTTDQVYAGLCALAYQGNVLAMSAPFEEETFITAATCGEGAVYTPLTREGDKRFPWVQGEQEAFFQDCLDIAARGLAARLERTGIRRMVLGLSGGLDSTMALLIMEEARRQLNLPPDALRVYTLPGPGTSERTLENARLLCQALGIALREISIREAVRGHLRDIGHDGRHDAAYENAQARERTQVLMDIANMVGGLVVGPGDMSELALGFTTYNGDHMSMYGVNAGMPKTLLRQLIAWYADVQEGDLGDALRRVLDTPISPELLPGGQQSQRTEDILGPYPLTDLYLWYFLKEGLPPAALVEKAQEAFQGQYTRGQLVSSLGSFYRRFFAAQFKRSCLPDGPQVLPISLSPRGGLRLPSDASANVWLEEIDRLLKEGQP